VETSGHETLFMSVQQTSLIKFNRFEKQFMSYNAILRVNSTVMTPIENNVIYSPDLTDENRSIEINNH